MWLRMRWWVLEAAAGAVSAMPNLRTLVFLGLADTDDHAYLFTVMVSLEPYVFECETRRVPPEPAERRPVFPHLP